jgi:hypothetical protein
VPSDISSHVKVSKSCRVPSKNYGAVAMREILI